MRERPSFRPSRRSEIAPFIVMEVLAAANARAAAGEDVLHLEVGEPAGGAPPAAIEAVTRALAEGSCGYTEAFGLPTLRERIARHYQDTYGQTVDPAQVAVTMGASGAFILAFLAAFDAGARVAVAAPGYPAYRNILTALGVEVVPVPTTMATRFQPTPELLAGVEGPLDGLVVASPANPAGTMLGAEELARLSGWCRARGVRLISDEIYHGITYETPAETVLASCRDAIVVNSFSKFFCMTGWRLGWLILPEDLVPATLRLSQNLFISAPTMAQHAALGAFEAFPELERRVEGYARNRMLLLHALHEAGLTRIAPPDGAFYLYADTAELGMGSVELCRRMLDEAGVAATPGVDFDPARGHDFVRFSFAGPEARVAEAADRLAAWLAKVRAEAPSRAIRAG